MDATSGERADLHEDLGLQGNIQISMKYFEEKITRMTRSFAKLKIDDPRDRFPLGALPPELVLEISDLLPGAAFLALAATCRDMRALIPKVLHKDKVSWKTFAQCVDRDALARACESEVNDDDQIKKACSGCHSLHPVQLFSAVQLHLPPKVRKCRGREGALYFGRDRKNGVSWESARKIALKTTGSPHFSTLVDHQEYELMRSISTPSSDVGFTLESRQIMQACIPGSTRANLSQVFLELLDQWADQTLCPHTTIGATLDHHIQAHLGLVTGSKRPVDQDTGLIVWKCAVHNCRSSVQMKVASFPSYFRTSIFILSTHSVRNLGKLRDPNDPLWIAQVERPRPTGWLDLSV
ncbi:hypothetical protein IWZ00DRAFT_496316 [Phyllosticta capitalensis]|uniref:F-box domain-containing protein n=1 Tax=Phyllosticta capitalensis TaxID=121624 RepID=A0ABR1Z3R4_9PEZI